MADADLEQRLTSIERKLADSASNQRIGLAISVGFVAFTVWQYFFAPPLVMTLRPVPRPLDCDDD